jgi:hypothetical protein
MPGFNEGASDIEAKGPPVRWDPDPPAAQMLALEPPHVASNGVVRMASIAIGAAGFGFHACGFHSLIGVVLCLLAALLNLGDLIYFWSKPVGRLLAPIRLIPAARTEPPKATASQ